MRSKKMGILLLSAVLLPAGLNAGAKTTIEGNISAIQGSRIELFNGLVKFEALGAKVDTEDPNFKNISDLKVGTFIDVEVETDWDGALHATLIEVSNEKDEVPEIGGVIGSVDTAAQTFTIGPLTISFNNQTKYKDLSGLRAGVLVEARVSFASGKLVAEFIEKDE